MRGEASQEDCVGAEQIAEIGADFADGVGVDFDDFGGVGVAGAPEVGEFFGGWWSSASGSGNFQAASLPRDAPAQNASTLPIFRRLRDLLAEAGVADFEAAAGTRRGRFFRRRRCRRRSLCRRSGRSGAIFRSRAPAEFGEAAGGRIVLNSGGKSQAIVEHVSQRNVVPSGKIWGR